MIQTQRIHQLNDSPVKRGDYVLYWMQASQREEHNHALEYAITKANKLHQPLLVFFGLTDSYPDAYAAHYQFMLEGLQETQQKLGKRNISFVVQLCSPEKGVIKLAADASCVLCDRGYLHHQRQWRYTVAHKVPCLCEEIETDVVVPVETVSEKEEYAAATIRPKIKRYLHDFLKPLPRTMYHHKKTIEVDSLDITSLEDTLQKLSLSDNGTKNVLKGGNTAAKQHLKRFIKEKLDAFPERRNDPSQTASSDMSPYLHFGQISPSIIALAVIDSHSPSIDTYLEELIIRRELSMNFVWYNPHYDSIQCLPQWAAETLKEHEQDKREYEYSFKELEKAQTHDPYWNAAQKQMAITGKMQGYMRMYWGKKLIEWIAHPRDAYQYALKLNNSYELDGRDPNGYTGVAWCFGKHDRPWKERTVFGKIRYMNDKGLERKFSMSTYVENIHRLTD